VLCQILSYLPIYPSRIVIRKLPLVPVVLKYAETKDKQAYEQSCEIPAPGWAHRYGVMPDGREISLGSTTDTSREEAEKRYRKALKYQFETWPKELGWCVILAPIHTKGTDFYPLEPLGADELPLVWGWTRENRVRTWREYFSFKIEPSGGLVSPRLPRSSMR
jgi:hypothetical protein